MTRFATSVAIAAAIVVLALASARAGDFDTMTNREYSNYVKDRLAVLTGAAAAMDRIAAKHLADCHRKTPGISTEDGARACEILRAANTREQELRTEENALLADLAKRYGGLPAWARRADAAFADACRHGRGTPALPGSAS